MMKYGCNRLLADITNLIPELLEFMDEGKMALSVGVELSFLDEQSQYDV